MVEWKEAPYYREMELHCCGEPVIVEITRGVAINGEVLHTINNASCPICKQEFLFSF
jgi:hypothetical protein